MSEETKLETQVQIQSYNLVDFVIEIANHARIGYEPNIESNDGYPQMYGPGFFTCGMIRKQTVTDVEVEPLKAPTKAADDATEETSVTDLLKKVLGEEQAEQPVQTEEPVVATADTTADETSETAESTEQLKTTKQTRKFTPKLN